MPSLTRAVPPTEARGMSAAVVSGSRPLPLVVCCTRTLIRWTAAPRAVIREVYLPCVAGAVRAHWLSRSHTATSCRAPAYETSTRNASRARASASARCSSGVNVASSTRAPVRS
jgi:hypothetical protein